MRTVWILAAVAAIALIIWIIAPDTWWLTIALTAGGVAAYKAVTISSLETWWRYAVGLPPAAGVFMVWWVDGHLLVLLLWILALLLMRLAVRGLFTTQREDRRF